MVADLHRQTPVSMTVQVKKDSLLETSTVAAETQHPKIKVLAEELHSAKTKWWPIGIQLEVPISSLQIIGSPHKDNPKRTFTELMDEWLKQTDPEPSWAQGKILQRAWLAGFENLSI